MLTLPKHLAPHVRELKLIAGTGCGKTKFAANLAAPAARDVLERCVGETNSTIIDHLVVFTTDKNQCSKMTVAVKYNSNAIPYSAFQEILTATTAAVIQKGRSIAPDEEKAVVAMREALEKELGKKNNLKAVFSLLPDEGREEFIRNVTGWYRRSQLWNENVKLYNTAKNLSQEQKPGKTSISLLSLIKTVVRDWFDQCPQDQKNSLQDIYNDVSDSLSQRFFNVFSPDHCSADGYYYRNLDLQNPDEDFCRQMFTANDVRRGTLSLEVLCSEIVIYVPMATAIADLLRQNPVAEKVFSDPQNNLVFGLRDTQGVFHADREEDQNVEYCSDLVYKNTPDAILVIAPLWGDQNGKKSQELYHNILQDYQKDTPIFLIHNKLDLFVDALVKNQDDFDALTGLSAGDTTELTLQEVNNKIRAQIEDLDRDLLAIQKKNGKRLNIYSVACFLQALNGALSPETRKGISQSYSLLSSCQSIFANLAKNLDQNAKKIAFVTVPNEEQVLSVDIAQLQTLLHTYLSSAEIQKTVLIPGAQNLGENDGITPHGNSYHAMGRRLQYGDSYMDSNYTSNINEDYYYNCQNIKITFPANIKNLLSPQLIHTLVFEILTLEGGTFRGNGNQEFLEAVEMELRKEQYKNELVRMLLYHGAFLKASNGMTAFSFRRQFQAFLDYSRPLLTPAKVDENAYAEALCDLVEEAGHTVMSRHIVFA
ncbi:MAG: hypothetical protein HDT20_05985 [Oscillibacter sp.]|nr:hypothetical protein [Oscillibacter sp.]